MKSISITACLLLVIVIGTAQDKPSKTQFMVRGYGHSGLNSFSDGSETETNFEGTAFAPIFLFKHSDRIMFEAELEFELEDEGVKIGFEYADFNYILNDYMTFRAGKFLLPFGTFVERYHPAWINKLSNMPLGFGHDGIAPSSGIGAELRGGFQLGYSKLNYSIYTTNGPILNTGADEPEESGILHFENYEDNNSNKAVGGRLGLLPFSNSSLELGFSMLTGKVGDEGDSIYENVTAELMAVDLSFVKQISVIKGIIDIKGQYNISNISDATYFETHPGDSIPEEYTFNNSSTAYYGQLSYRPSMLENKFFKNVEIVGRYSVIQTPEGAEWEQEATQLTVGLNYWLSWRSVLKFSYQMTESEGGHGGSGVTNTTGMFFHWALGF